MTTPRAECRPAVNDDDRSARTVLTTPFFFFPAAVAFTRTEGDTHIIFLNRVEKIRCYVKRVYQRVCVFVSWGSIAVWRQRVYNHHHHHQPSPGSVEKNKNEISLNSTDRVIDARARALKVTDSSRKQCGANVQSCYSFFFFQYSFARPLRLSKRAMRNNRLFVAIIKSFFFFLSLFLSHPRRRFFSGSSKSDEKNRHTCRADFRRCRCRWSSSPVCPGTPCVPVSRRVGRVASYLLPRPFLLPSGAFGSTILQKGLFDKF